MSRFITGGFSSPFELCELHLPEDIELSLEHLLQVELWAVCSEVLIVFFDQVNKTRPDGVFFPEDELAAFDERHVHLAALNE